MKSKLKENKGITLIALVVTIIVLLILAGVTLNLIMGKSGILTMAQKAKKQTNISSAVEEIRLAILDVETKAQIEEQRDATLKDLVKELEKKEETYLIENSDGKEFASLDEKSVIVTEETEAIKITNLTTYKIPVSVNKEFEIYCEGMEIENTQEPEKIYTVTYDSNGGTGEVPEDQQEYKSKEIVKVKFDKIPTKPNCIFLGWSKSADSTQAEYTQESNNSFEMENQDVTLYAVWQSDWQTWLSKADIDYSKYTSLNDFVTNGTSEDKTKVSENANARSYLLSSENLINTLKATENYGSNMVSYLLSTDKTKNTENYNVGLPAYITKGNVLYLGGTWIIDDRNLASYDITNADYIRGSISSTVSYGSCIYTSNKINISNFSKLVFNAYNSKSGGRDVTSFCSFGSGTTSAGLELKYGNYINSEAKDIIVENLGTGDYYFGMSVITYGGTTTSYLNYSYIY